MASGAASTRGASQLATDVAPQDVVAWEKAEALAATRRAVNALQTFPLDGSNDAFREVLQNVHLLLKAPGADHAAEAFKLITGVATTCPERVPKAVKIVAREVRDVLVLRCLSEMDSNDHGNRDAFLAVVARAFGQTSSEEYEDKILHSHSKLTEGRAMGFPSKTQLLGRHRRRRIRPAEENVGPGQEMNTPVSDNDLGQEISKAVALFLAGKESSDGASISD